MQDILGHGCNLMEKELPRSIHYRSPAQAGFKGSPLFIKQGEIHKKGQADQKDGGELSEYGRQKAFHKGPSAIASIKLCRSHGTKEKPAKDIGYQDNIVARMQKIPKGPYHQSKKDGPLAGQISGQNQVLSIVAARLSEQHPVEKSDQRHIQQNHQIYTPVNELGNWVITYPLRTNLMNKPCTNEYQGSNPYNQEQKTERIEIFCPFTLNIITGQMPRPVGQLKNEAQYCFIGVGKCMHQIVPDMVQVKPVGMGGLTTVTAILISFQQSF
jgi:hypothetical protein